MRSRLALTLLVITVVCVTADTVITAASGALLSRETWAVHGWPLATAASLGYSVMGALILARHPGHRMGWLLCIVGLSSVAQATQAYSYWVLDSGGPGPATAGHVAGWVSVLFSGPLASSAVTFVFLLVPDGHLPSRRWWWAAGTTVAGIALNTGAQLSVPPTQFRLTDDTATRGGLAGGLFTLGLALMLVGLLASALSLFVRLRRSRGLLRRQLLWIATSAVGLAAGFLFLAVMGVLQGEQTVLGATPLFTAYLAFPVATAVAVLRHGLFDIELIVNRALLVTLATAVVAAGYVAVVVGLGAAVGGGGFWLSLAATAVVAMAFQPMRRRIVRLADRLAYGSAAVPYEALADLSRRLGDSPDPAALLPAIADAAGTTVGAHQVTVRMHLPHGPDQTATWTGPHQREAHEHTDFEITLDGDVLGTIEVTMPAGRTLRGFEHRLVQDLADGAATAVRGAHLSTELGYQVRRLDEHTIELAASRRRLISAGDAERRRLEQSIAHHVLHHLEPLPTRLELLAGRPSGAATLDDGELDSLITATSTALEQLREITRGVFPAQLARSGLEPALASLLARHPHGRLETGSPTGNQRMHPAAEAAAFYCVAELLAHHSGPVDVLLTMADDLDLLLRLTGPRIHPLPLHALQDRVDALDGVLSTRAEDGGIDVHIVLPGAGSSGDTPDPHVARPAVV